MPAFVDDTLEFSMSLHLFQNVTNTADVRNFIFKNKLAVCLLRPQYVWDRFHISAAITKALQNLKDGTQRTRSLGTEMLYWISPSTNISESLKTFGTAEEDKEMLIISSHEEYTKFCEIIKGEEIPLEQLGRHRDESKILETYGIAELDGIYHSPELLPGTIVSKVMTKEFN